MSLRINQPGREGAPRSGGRIAFVTSGRREGRQIGTDRVGVSTGTTRGGLYSFHPTARRPTVNHLLVVESHFSPPSPLLLLAFEAVIVAEQCDGGC